MNGAHTVVAPFRQAPSPLQTLVPTIAPMLQVPGWHTVPRVRLRHFPAPSQVPSRPQLLAGSALHWPGSRGFTPAGVIVHVPSEVGSAQVMHMPPHALLQQTPSTQKPLLQSAAQEQVSPLSRTPAPQPPSISNGRSLAPSV